MDYIALLKTLEALAVADYVRSATWAYPILETFHMFGLGLVFGGMFVFDVRLLGLHRSLSLVTLANHILPWVWLGFLINMISGILLFVSDAVTFGLNLAFQIKVVLLGVTGLSVLWFQRRVYPHLKDWDRNDDDRNVAPPRSVRTLALVSIVMWMAIITAGRMIAYVPEPEIEEAASLVPIHINGTTQSPLATRNTGQAKWRAPDVTKI